MLRPARKKGVRTLAVVLALLSITMAVPRASAASGAPWVSAASAVLVDERSGQVMYAKDPRARRPIASTTKILTTIICLEHLRLTEPVTVSRRANEVGESEVYLEVGESLTAMDMLYGVMVRSGNDAAVALCEKVAGSVEIFAEMMNDKAKELGMQDSHFRNPDGLPVGDHYSSAQDMANLSIYAMRNPVFRKLAATKKVTLPWPGKPWRRVLVNRNKLLLDWKYCTGIKTGTTDEAGHCLVASAEKDGDSLIAVVLKSRDSFSDARRLLGWGLDNYRGTSLIDDETVYARLRLEKGRGTLPLKANRIVLRQVLNGSDLKWNKVIYFPHPELPVRRGRIFGRLTVTCGDQVLAEANLVAARTVRETE